MADYRDHNAAIRAAGASIAAVSVDSEEKSGSVRRDLDLPFPILCDTGRRVVIEWDIYNSREKDGIAKPAAFLIDRDRTVRFAAVDTVATRVPASEILALLQTANADRKVRRKTYIPRPADWFRALRNEFHR